MMFGWLFGEDDEEVVVKKEEKVEQKVEPVVEEEQKRKEKFSEPLIYNDEVQPVKVEEKPVAKTSKPASTTTQKKKTQSRRFDNTSDYKLVDIISPMSGLVDAASKGDDGKAPVTKKKRYRPKKEELVPVLSPFYGMGNVAEDDEENDKNEDVVEETVETIENVETIEEVKEEKPKEKKKRAPRKKREKVVLEAPDDNDKPVDSAKVIGSVEDRLRNIATISEQTQDDLKIIEERTGKFRLIRKKDESLIDEIDDNMSLDELMTLYEKKFKD